MEAWWFNQKGVTSFPVLTPKTTPRRGGFAVGLTQAGAHPMVGLSWGKASSGSLSQSVLGLAGCFPVEGLAFLCP